MTCFPYSNYRRNNDIWVDRPCMKLLRQMGRSWESFHFKANNCFHFPWVCFIYRLTNYHKNYKIKSHLFTLIAQVQQSNGLFVDVFCDIGFMDRRQLNHFEITDHFSCNIVILYFDIFLCNNIIPTGKYGTKLTDFAKSADTPSNCLIPESK